MGCYITGFGMRSSLGGSVEEVAQRVACLDEDSYEKEIRTLRHHETCYAMPTPHLSAREKFYGVIEEEVRKVIETAGLSARECEELAIFIGSTSMSMSVHEAAYEARIALGEEGACEHLGYGHLGTFVEGIVGSRRKTVLFSTACTSSANALCYGAKMLRQGAIKRALVLGIELFNRATFEGFSSLLLLSKEGMYRPFDHRSDGIILGEGCSVLLLETHPRHEDDFYYMGSASNCDSTSETTSDPSGIPIFEAMHGALEDAGIALGAVDAIKAHATGSENNTVSEVNALLKLFHTHGCTPPVTAMKPFLGHTLGASGTNEIALLLACAKQGFVPPVFGFKVPMLDFTPLTTPLKDLKKATFLFNFVAFGGSNTAIVLSNQ
ncbi:MAG: beta-ketoacyl synthase [Campylobacterales bacterium]|nr:beta-ketoacyl synthase [Campylobacterales bacterium]